jgi:hypothetical protein
MWEICKLPTCAYKVNAEKTCKNENCDAYFPCEGLGLNNSIFIYEEYTYVRYKCDVYYASNGEKLSLITSLDDNNLGNPDSRGERIYFRIFNSWEILSIIFQIIEIGDISYFQLPLIIIKIGGFIFFLSV